MPILQIQIRRAGREGASGRGQTQSSEPAEGLGEHLPGVASWKGQAALLSPPPTAAGKVLARHGGEAVRLPIPSQGQLGHHRLSCRHLSPRTPSTRLPTSFLQWAADCNWITGPSRAPCPAYHFLQPPAPWGEALRQRPEALLLLPGEGAKKTVLQP